MIKKSVVEQEASSDFLAGGGVLEDASSLGCRMRDIAKGKDRSEDEKYEVKATHPGSPKNASFFGVGQLNRFLNHERYTPLF